jgi:hypothetical protein
MFWLLVLVLRCARSHAQQGQEEHCALEVSKSVRGPTLIACMQIFAADELRVAFCVASFGAAFRRARVCSISDLHVGPENSFLIKL